MKDFPWGWGLGLLGATGFVFRGTFFEWIQKAFDFTINNGSLKKFFETLKKGPDHLKEAYEQLVYDTDNPTIEYFSDELDIEKRHLAELQTVGYNHFKEQRAKDRKKSYLTKGLEWAGVQVEDIPFTNVDDELKRVAEEDKIADYIEAHKAELKISDKELEKLTIGEIFQKFLALKAHEQVGEKGEKTEEGDDKSPENGDLTITDDPEKAKGELPATAEAFKRAKDAESKEEAAVILTEGALKDGATLVQTEWGTFIAKGATGILVSSGTILADEFKHAGLFVYNAGRGDFHGAAKNVVEGGISWYENGGVWFMGTGMAMGTMAALWKGESITRGLTIGGLRGALLGPVGAIWNSIKMVKAGEKGLAKVLTEADYRMAQAQNEGEKLGSLFRTQDVKITRAKDQALRHIKEYEKYFDRVQRVEKGRLTDAHLVRLNTLEPEHFERMEKFHFVEFGKSWEDYQRAKGVKNPKFPYDLRDFREHREDIKEFIHAFQDEVNPRAPQMNSLDETKARLAPDAIEAQPNMGKIEALRKSVEESDAYMKSFQEKVEQMTRDGKPQTEIDALTQETRAHLEEVRTRYKSIFEDLKTHSKELSKEEQTALKGLLKTEMAHASGVRGILREMGERSTGKLQIIFGTAAIGLEYLEWSDEQKEAYAAGKVYDWGKEFGWDVLQIIADVLSPFGASDWYTVATGKELFTGKEAGTWNRLTRVVFGAYNLGSDALAAIGGGATVEVGGAGGAAIYGTSNTIEGALRAAGKGPEVIAAAKAIVPEVQGLAKALGGYQELLRVMKNVAGKGMVGVTAVEVGKLGYELIFDTKDQEPIEIDLPLAEDPEETPAK